MSDEKALIEVHPEGEQQTTEIRPPETALSLDTFAGKIQFRWAPDAEVSSFSETGLPLKTERMSHDLVEGVYKANDSRKFEDEKFETIEFFHESRMVVADLEAGQGLTVIDPHGALVEDLLETIPRSRTNDVIYINPADQDAVIGLNVLESVKERERSLLVSSLISILRNLYPNNWVAWLIPVFFTVAVVLDLSVWLPTSRNLVFAWLT